MRDKRTNCGKRTISPPPNQGNLYLRRVPVRNKTNSTNRLCVSYKLASMVVPQQRYFGGLPRSNLKFSRKEVSTLTTLLERDTNDLHVEVKWLPITRMAILQVNTSRVMRAIEIPPDKMIEAFNHPTTFFPANIVKEFW